MKLYCMTMLLGQILLQADHVLPLAMIQFTLFFLILIKAIKRAKLKCTKCSHEKILSIISQQENAN